MNQGDNPRNDQNNGGTFERMGEQLGGAAGKMMGRGSDMATEMFGNMLGNAMNALGDWWTSPDAQRAAGSFDQTRDRSCRDHFEASASASTGREYDQVRPLYQFGHVAGQNPDYRGRSFDEVEPDLQRAWKSESSSQSDWPEVRGYVDFGYSQSSGEGPKDF
jgi:hypothetical protein